LAYQIITFNTDFIIEKALLVGRTGTFLNKLKNKFSAYSYHQNINSAFTINQEETISFLQNNFAHFETPALNAKLIYEPLWYTSNMKFAIEEETYGQILNYEKALINLIEKLKKFDNSSIHLEAKVNYPEIHKKDCLNIGALAKKIILKAPLSLSYAHSKWILNKNDLLPLLTLKKRINSDIIVSLDEEKTQEFLEEKIADFIDETPQEAKFEIKDGKVIEFQTSKDGKKLNAFKNYELIEYLLLNGTSSNVELIVDDLKSEINNETVNNLGIKEIIGIGHSSFAGSPSNRRHNIRIGAEAINGSLIKPGEEFSLNKTLGEINAETGYLPELVIKDNQTIPEYGGGLCQIGTTLFRGTTASGLPVTQRRNHSYRVFYYEPAGTDATIYSPWPDYKFVNDTKNHILIQHRIEGDDLYFDFWGTLDGRIATSSYPTIYNITRPAPTKIIETLDLEPGIKKCTEHAHNGADAYFDYSVEYPQDNPPQDAEDEKDLLREVRFKSHYTPWREVCLLGVEKLSTSTEEILED
jgi:vancomycin resistance protein YoaR